MIATGVLTSGVPLGVASGLGRLDQTKAAVEPQLVQISFADVAGWQHDDHAPAFAAFRTSCPATIELHRTSTEPRLVALTAACMAAIDRGPRPIGRGEARRFFEHYFAPHRYAPHGLASTRAKRSRFGGLLTGYYEPLIEGSLVRTARFNVPLYRRPADLENVVIEAERSRSGLAFSHLRRTASGLEPYPTRAEIDGGALDRILDRTGHELPLVWLADPIDAFFAQIQGSARIGLPDGRRIGLAYDGKNGHPYTSIGRVLIDMGEMTAAEMSMSKLAAYLRADAARGRAVMQRNASYVFFRFIEPENDTGAVGALGVRLSPGRSLAVDTQHHPLGAPIFVDAPSLRHWGRREPYQRLMIAHDVGSAIRGRERGDIYFGSGSQAAARAGITKHAARFVLLVARGTQERRQRRLRS